MEAVGNEPLLRWSRAVAGMTNMGCYSISWRRSSLPRAQRVAHPAHQIVYRRADAGVVEILAVVGGSYPAARSLRGARPGGQVQ
jgi:hypothetical protein